MTNLVILTGAGISAESGIATFRASDGLWERHRIEDVATPEGFARNPQLVQDFYNARRRQLASDDVTPNTAHEALARLERHCSGSFLLVTQNVDNLHERAGSVNVLHMHGELLKVRCECSGEVYDWLSDITPQDLCTCCQPGRRLRPHIVWFGEMPLGMDVIYNALTNADMFISIGTSGNVYPASGFVQLAREAGAHTVELNLDPSQGQGLFAQKIYGPATQVVPRFVDALLADL